MKKIAELDYASEHSAGRIMWGKLNEVIRAVNGLKCVEEEEPIYEVLDKYECLIISKNEEGLLVACNTGGIVELERVKYPKEEAEK
jgi:ribosomal protein L22